MTDLAKLETQVAELVCRLPPMPAHLESVMEALSDVGADEEKMVRLIRRDPGLCAELLHLANTCFGETGAVATIEEAVRCVGTAPLVEMVAASYAGAAVQEEFRAIRHLDQYFAHSREIATTARILARVCHRSPHDCESFSVAGLLHDIGRLVILIVSNSTSTPLAGVTWEQMISLVRDEKRVVGMNHCEVGQQICERWNFTPFLQEGVLRHHTPLVGRDFSFPGTVLFLAHFVAGSDFTGAILEGMVSPELFAKVGLTPAGFEEARELYRVAAPR